MQKDNSKIETLKLWVFPSLVSLLAVLIWNDVNEIKSDVKALMAQSNIDKTRIDNLERIVYKTAEVPFQDKRNLTKYPPLVAIKPEDQPIVTADKPKPKSV